MLASGGEVSSEAVVSCCQPGACPEVRDHFSPLRCCTAAQKRCCTAVATKTPHPLAPKYPSPTPSDVFSSAISGFNSEDKLAQLYKKP